MIEIRNLNGQVLRKVEADNLSGADLSGADLRYADLSGAGLSGADLRYANLSGANLSGADLSGANLSGARLPDFQLCPQEGSFIAFKKLQGGVIAKLGIPKSAARTSSLVGRKCRAEFARVLELSIGTEAFDTYTGNTLYKVGERVYPDSYDADIRVECTHGIHFFITRKEAEQY